MFAIDGYTVYRDHRPKKFNKGLASFVLLAGVIIGFAAWGFVLPNATHAQQVTFDQNLYYGITGSTQVQALQEFLTVNNYYNGPITGNFYSLTLQGVKNFQGANSVPTTGYFGVLSRGVANTVLASSEPAPSIAETGTSTSATTPDNQSVDPVGTQLQTFIPPIAVPTQTQIQNSSGGSEAIGTTSNSGSGGTIIAALAPTLPAPPTCTLATSTWAINASVASQYAINNPYVLTWTLSSGAMKGQITFANMNVNLQPTNLYPTTGFLYIQGDPPIAIWKTGYTEINSPSSITTDQFGQRQLIPGVLYVATFTDTYGQAGSCVITS